MIPQIFSRTSLLLLAFLFLLGNLRETQAAVPFVEQIRQGEHVRIGTMGTSLTAPDLQGDSWASAMKAWLMEQSPDPEQVYVQNFGKSFSSSSNEDQSLSAVDSQLKQAMVLDLDVVFIEFSMNDAYRGYEITQDESLSNVNFMIDQLYTSNPEMTIILQTMNDEISGARPDLDAYYEGYRRVAQERELMLIDYHPEWQELHQSNPDQWSTYLPDGVHPTAEGRAAITLPVLQANLMQTVPEPSSAFLLLLAGLGFVNRRTRG